MWHTVRLERTTGANGLIFAPENVTRRERRGPRVHAGTQGRGAMISGIKRATLAASRIVFAAVGAACAMLPWIGAADESAAATPVFTDSEIRIILSHGPWPAPVPPEPNNRVSGKPRGDRVRDAPVLRSAPLRQRHDGLRELPRAGAQLDRQPPARRRHDRARSQDADGREPARPALVRLGRRRRQPLVPEPAPDGGPA